MRYSDRPIKSKDQDVLNRSDFAKLLAKTLVNCEADETFTVGLFGKWGCGKTSLVNMTLSEIEEIQKAKPSNEPRLITVHFEPWNFSSTDQLLTQFFLRLSDQFKGSNEELNKLALALEKYSAALRYLEVIPQIGSIARVLAEMFSATACVAKQPEETDIVKQKEEIEQLLGEQQDRILVVIDDIDRLTNEQIRCVFQLITSIANFPNTTYLVVFDKEVVVDALEEVQKGSGEEYLEKIIQMPIEVPKIQEKDLLKSLFERLDEGLSAFDGVLFEKNHWEELFPYCVKPYIKHLRDVNRLCNSLRFKLTAIATEINYVDMIAISTIEIHHPMIYKWVQENKPLLTGENDLSALIDRDKKAETWYQESFVTLNELVAKEYPDVSSHQQQIMTKSIIEALVRLFPNFGRKVGKIYQVFDMNTLMRNDRIAHPDKFDRYFELNMDAVCIKRSDITRLINSMPESEIIEYLLRQDREEARYEALEHINARNNELSEKRAKLLIVALLKSIGELKQEVQKSLFSMSAGAYAERMILDLIERISEEHRKDFLADTLKISNAGMLQSIASVLNMIELGYGRLSAEGKPHDYKKVITEDELVELEQCFVEHGQQLFEEFNLFDFAEWRLVLHLLNAFDPEYMDEYLQRELKNDKHTLQYLCSFVSIWRGAGFAYEIEPGWEKYLTNERIMTAMANCLECGTFFDLSENDQHKCAAFYLHHTEDEGRRSRFNQPETATLLATWERERSITSN